MSPRVELSVLPCPVPGDPYLRWAQLSGWLRLRPQGRWPAQLSFIVERSSDHADWQALRAALASPPLRASIPQAYDQPLPNGQVARFATLRLPARTDEPQTDIDARIAHLSRLAGIARLQLGYPRGAAEPHASAEPPDDSDAASTAQADVVIGVIDDGCPFGHPALLDPRSQQPRIASLWQQSTRNPVVSPWAPAPGFGYGRVLDATAMSALLHEATRLGRVEERLLYELAFSTDDDAASAPAVAARWRKPSRALLSRASHGASVLGLAAAPARPAYGLQDDETRSHRPYVAPEAGEPEPAACCPLICVDLPREQVEISSGRWMPINALDGIRFIAGQARGRFHGPHQGWPVPVVINLSSGALAGAHVGEAMLERAMDELLAADERLAITLAAGNSRTADAHAGWTVAPGGSAGVGVFVPPCQPFDTCVELWLPHGADLRTLRIQVRPPANTAARPEAPVLEVGGARGIGQAVLSNPGPETLSSGSEGCQAALLLYPTVVQALGRTMALLAISGTTVTSRRRQPAPTGPWTITVLNDGRSPCAVQAWIERDEVVFGQRREQIARFFSLSPAGIDAADERPHAVPVQMANTLSNIASGRLPLPVGAYRGRARRTPTRGGEWPAGAVASYSGQPSDPPDGAPRTYLPFAAVADAGKSHPGIRAIGNHGDTLRRMNGTSAAAPQAARYLANAMARGATRQAVLSALPAEPEARGPGGPDPADGRLRL